MIYNRALSQSEITQRLNFILDPANETGLIAYYRFEEGTGSAINDLSGNNLNGSAVNCSWSNDVPFSSGISKSLNFSGTKYICPNDSILIMASNKPSNKYKWYRNGNVITNANTSTYYASPVGAYYCLVTDTVGNCSTSTDTINILSSQVSAPLVNGPFVLFSGNMNASYSTPSLSGYTFQWLVNNGSIQSGQNTSSINVIWNYTGPYSLTLYADSNGCKNSSTILISPPTLTSTKCNKYSVFLNGSNSYISIPDNTKLKPDNLTISFYFKTSSSAMQALINKWSIADGANLNYGITINHNFWSPVASYAATTHHGTNCTPGNGYSIISFQNGTVPTNAWINFTLTYDGVTQKIFLNGIQIQSNNTNKGPIGKCAGGSLLIGIGSLLSPIFFNGKLDEIMIYDKALSANAIKQRQITVLDALNETGLIAYYRFEEGSGIQANDYSGNQFNGILNNCTWSSDVPYNVGISKSLNFSGIKYVCPNDSVLIQSSNSSSYKYKWYKDGIQILNVNTFSCYAALSGKYYCLITDTIGNCSTMSDTLTIVSSQINPPVFNGPFVLFSSNLNATYLTTPISGYTYQWVINNGTILSGQNSNSINVLWNTSGPYSITLIADTNGCKNSTTMFVSPSSYTSTKCNSFSVSFNGSNTYISIPDNTKLKPDDITLSFYFKTSSTAMQSLINKWSLEDGSNLNYGVTMNHNAFNPIASFAYTDAHGINCTAGAGFSTVTFQNGNVPTNTWQNLTITYNGIQQKIYLNGLLVSTKTTNAGPIGKCTGGALLLGIGSLLSPNYLNGKIDEVMIYNRALTSTEVVQRQNMVLNTFIETGLIGYYRFEEGTGIQINDYSGNQLNGVLFNGSWSSDVPYIMGINKSLNLSGVKYICPGDSILLQNTGNTSCSFQWYKNGNLVSKAQNATFYVSQNGIYTCLITDTIGKCSKFSDTVEIQSYQIAPPVINGPFVLTSGNLNVSYNTKALAGYQFQWIINNGTILSGQNTNTIQVLWNPTGTYTLTLNVDTNGCKNSANIIVSPPTFSSTKCNKHSIAFNGTNSYIKIPDDTKLKPDNVTISLYLKTSSTAMQALINKWTIADGSNLNYGVTINHSFWNPVATYAATTHHGTLCSPGSGFSIISMQNGTVPTNNWVNFTLTYDGVIQKIYLNGTMVQSSITNKGPIGKCAGGDLLIGIGSLLNPIYFNGNMDEIMIYDRALTANEVLQRQNLVLHVGSETGLIAYYRFEEGANNQANDYSGNGMNGTIYNANWSNDVPFNTGFIAKLNTNGSKSICNNDSLVLQVPSQSSFNYLWFNGSVPISLEKSPVFSTRNTGNYYCKITDTIGGCIYISDSVFLSVVPNPAIPNITGPMNLAGGNLSAVYTCTKPSSQYIWNINNGIIQSGQSTSTVNVTWNASGPYSLKVEIDSNGCKSTNIINVTKGVGMTSSDLEYPIRVYPNPTEDVIYLDILQSDVSKAFSIIDLTGKMVLSGTLKEKVNMISLASLEPGLYFINVSNYQKIKIIKK